MKTVKTALAIILSVMMLASLVLSAPLTTSSATIFNRIYPTKGGKLSELSEYVTLCGNTAISHESVGTDYFKIKSDGISSDVSNPQSFNDLNSVNEYYDYSYLPSVTYYVFAPADGNYEIKAAMNGNSPYMAMSVNDIEFYKLVNGNSSTTTNQYTASQTIHLVQGYNFVRFVLRDATTNDKWLNFCYMEIDSRLTAVSNKAQELIPKDSPYFNGCTNGNNLENMQNVKDSYGTYYYNKRGEDIFSSFNPATMFKSNNGGSSNTSYVPFVSYTLNFASSGYYDINMQNGTGYNSVGYCILSIDGVPKQHKFRHESQSNTKSAEEARVNFSTYFSAGKHVVTFTAPFGLEFSTTPEAPWFNLKTITINGANGVTVLSKNDSIDPSVTVQESDYIFADECAVFSGQENGSYSDGTFGNSHLKIYNGNSSGQQNQASHKEPSSGHKIVGGLTTASLFTKGMQSYESMINEGYVNKSYLPMVAYQVEVPTAGDYSLDVFYSLCLANGCKYNDYYTVVAVNDNNFYKASFYDDCSTHHPDPSATGSNNHFSKSTVAIKLEKGVNIIRCILAVKETAPMLIWGNEDCIKLRGPSKVTGVKVANVRQENDPNRYVASFNIGAKLKNNADYVTTFADDTNAKSIKNAYNYAGANCGSYDPNNPRAKYSVGGAYFTSIPGGSDGRDAFYHLLTPANIIKTPGVRYTLKVSEAGYYDMEMTYRAAKVNAESNFIFAIVDSTNNKFYKVKRHFKGTYVAAGASSDGQYYDNAVNLSCYLPQGEYDVFILNPLDNAFYDTYLWIDLGAFRVGVSDDYVKVSHPSENYSSSDTTVLRDQDEEIAERVDDTDAFNDYIRSALEFADSLVFDSDDVDTAAAVSDLRLQIINSTYSDNWETTVKKAIETAKATAKTNVQAARMDAFDANVTNKLNTLKNTDISTALGVYSDAYTDDVYNLVSGSVAAAQHSDAALPLSPSNANLENLYNEARTRATQYVTNINSFENDKETTKATVNTLDKVKLLNDFNDYKNAYHTGNNYLPANLQDAYDEYYPQFDNTKFDLKKSLSDNNDIITTVKNNLISACLSRCKELKYQLGIYKQFQTKKTAVGTGGAYVRLFFEIDEDNNDYIPSNGLKFMDGKTDLYGKHGFIINIPSWNVGRPNYTECMSFEGIETLTYRKEGGDLETLKPCDKDYHEHATYGYNDNYTGRATHFVYMYIFVPEELWNTDINVTAFVNDGELHYSKTTSFNVAERYSKE